jgi:hypothetical protein
LIDGAVQVYEVGPERCEITTKFFYVLLDVSFYVRRLSRVGLEAEVQIHLSLVQRSQ